MTDLVRFGMFVVGFPVVVFASGIVLGLIGRTVTRRREPRQLSRKAA